MVHPGPCCDPVRVWLIAVVGASPGIGKSVLCTSLARWLTGVRGGRRRVHRHRPGTCPATAKAIIIACTTTSPATTYANVR